MEKGEALWLAQRPLASGKRPAHSRHKAQNHISQRPPGEHRTHWRRMLGRVSRRALAADPIASLRGARNRTGSPHVDCGGCGGVSHRWKQECKPRLQRSYLHPQSSATPAEDQRLSLGRDKG